MECYCGETHTDSFDTALAALKEAPGSLAHAVDQVRASRLSRRPGRGRWSVAEIVGHLKNFELVSSIRFRLLLTEDVPDLPPFDPDRWVSRFESDRQDPKAAIDLFGLLRADNVRLLQSLGEADRHHEGWHPEHGSVTVEAMTIHLAAHDAQRLEEIRKRRS